MTNEHDIRDAFVAIAETDPIDDAGGWTRITAGIEDDAKRRRRHRLLIGGAGVAVLGAAAALAVVAAQGDPRPEAVDTSPATQPTVSVPTEPTVSVPNETVQTQPRAPFPAGFGGAEPIPTTGPVPEHPLLVLRQNEETGATSLFVLDGDSGEILGMPAVEPNFSISDPVITRDGLIAFTRETGDSSHIEMLEWGSADPAVFGDLDETGSPAFSPDGDTFAYVEQGVTTVQATIVLTDMATGQEIRRLTWRDDETDFFRTNGSIRDLEWSPDGSRLLFISSYEGAEGLIVDADAESLSDAVRAVEADVLSVSWSGDDSIVALGWCCYPEYDGGRQAYAGPVGAGEPAFGDEQFDDVDAGPNGEVVLVADGGVTILGTDAQRRDVIGTESGVVSAELF